MRCGCILVIAAIASIMFGIQGVREAHAFSKPVDITCQQFMLAAPQEGWYRIKDCELSVDESVYMVTTSHSKYSSPSSSADESDKNSADDKSRKESKAADKSGHTGKDAAETADADKTGNGSGEQAKGTDTVSEPSPRDYNQIRKVYLPVHGSGTWDEKKNAYPTTNLVIETEDPTVIATANELKAMDKKSPAEFKKWLAANSAKLVIHKDIVGMVQTGLHSEEKTRTQISKLQESLSPGYLIVDEGRTPSMASGLGALFGGVLLGILSVLYWVSYLYRWQRRSA
jgi:hypothetical protein